MTEIPEALIKQFQGLGAHFIRAAKRGKEPIDKGWPDNPMSADDPKLQEWLKEDGNYGIVGGYGLTIVDADTQELKKLILDNLPRTFTAESPGSKGWHCSFLCGLEKPIRLRDKDGKNIGDIQGQGKMVVGPGSTHPNGGTYKIIVDRSLAQVTREQLVEAFKDYVIPEREFDEVKRTARLERKRFEIQLDISQVMSFASLRKQGNEYFGSHPVHGSKTKKNFWVNPRKNMWHCFRHSSGGGPLLWLAVEEGIIDCAEAGSQALRGEAFKQVLEKAKERGLIKEDVKIEGITGTIIGNYRLKKRGRKVFLLGGDGKPVVSCNLESVDGSHFKKRLKEITGLEEAEVDRVTASFQLALQSIKKSVEPKENDQPQLSAEEMVRREQQTFGAVSIHPLLDYTENTGLTIGGFLQGFKKHLIFSHQNVFAVDFGGLMLENPESNSVLVRKVKACRLNRNQEYLLLNLARDVLRNEEIEIPTFSGVFQRVLEKTRHYYYHIDFRYYIAVACWIIGTYMFVIFDVYPPLHPQGERETGKSTLIFLLRALCWNPTNPECSLREADLFRTVEGCQPTYLVDATKLPRNATDVNDMFESGYEKGGSVRRCDPLTFEPRDYQTYSPKAIATRQSIQFSAKSIEIITTKADDIEYTKRRVHLKDDPEHQEIIGDIFKSMVLGEAWRPVRETYYQIEQTDKLNGRRFRLWQPLLAICRVFAPEHYEELWKLAEEDAERAETGDRVSEVEEAVLTILVQIEEKTCTLLLKKLTENVIELVPWVKNWHIVKSAIKNLGILKRAYSAKGGATYQFNLEKVKLKASQKGISIEATTPTEESATTCWICNKSLPTDGRNTTVEEGKTCHIECSRKLKAGRREKDSEGKKVVVKAYEFDTNKLKRISKKYGYELVTRLLPLLGSEGVRESNSTLKTAKDNVENKEYLYPYKGSEELERSKRSEETPSETEKESKQVVIGKIKRDKSISQEGKPSNVVTDEPVKPVAKGIINKIWEQPKKTVPFFPDFKEGPDPLPPEKCSKGHCAGCKKNNIQRNYCYTDFSGNPRKICDECHYELLKQLGKGVD